MVGAGGPGCSTGDVPKSEHPSIVTNGIPNHQRKMFMIPLLVVVLACPLLEGGKLPLTPCYARGAGDADTNKERVDKTDATTSMVYVLRVEARQEHVGPAP